MNWPLFIIFNFVVWLFVSSLLYGIIRLSRGKEIANRNVKFLSFLVLCGLVGGLLPRFLGEAAFTYFPLAVAILLGGYLIIAHLNWYYQKSQAGEVLVNLGQPRRQSYYFWTGSFLLLLAIVQTLGVFFFGFESFLLYNAPWIGVLALLSLSISFAKCELREKALFIDLNVWHWSDIEAYEWQDNQPTDLILWLKTRFSNRFRFFNRCRLPVNPNQQQNLEETLRDRGVKRA